MKYTKEQYEASAAKHGFPDGKWVTVAGTVFEFEYIAIESPLGWKPAIACMVPPCNLWPTCVALHVDEVRALTKAFVQLPDLLIERDEKDAEIERLTTAAQNACDALHQWRAAENTNDAAELGNARTSRDKAYEELRAALQGGGTEEEHEPERAEPQPIGTCPHCHTPVYTDVGFCGVCRGGGT